MKRETGFPRLGYIFLRLSFQLAEFFKMEKNCANIKCTRITLRMVIFGYRQCIQKCILYSVPENGVELAILCVGMSLVRCIFLNESYAEYFH